MDALLYLIIIFLFLWGVVSITDQGISKPKKKHAVYGDTYFDKANIKYKRVTETIEGQKFLVNFKRSGYYEGDENNDPLPATLSPYKSRFYIIWDNGNTSVMDKQYLNIYSKWKK